MRKIPVVLSALMLCAVITLAQDTEDAALAQKYKGENGVITSETEHLEIRFDRGELKAYSHNEREVLLLTDLAAAAYAKSSIYHSFFNKLSGDVKGFTLVPEKKGYKQVKAKEIRTVKSTSSGVFYDDGYETIVTHASLTKGVKTRIVYDIEHTDIHFMPGFYFQSNLPVERTEFKVTVPNSVKLGWQLRGNLKELIKEQVEVGRNSTTYTWSAANLPRVQTFENAPATSYYLPHILIYIKEYTAPRENRTERVFGNVDDLYRFYYPFIKDINKTTDANLKQQVATLIAGADTEKEKAQRIYQWVQKNLKYVAFEDGLGGFIPRDASLVCNRKYGDCKDMASVLVAMCGEAGIKAYYTWIGTRHKPYRYDETPLPVADNHMICTINIGDEWIFLDGTDARIPFGFPPYSIQGKEALVGLSKDKYKVIKVPELKPSVTAVSDSTALKLTGKSLQGSVHLNMRGYSAWSLEDMMLYYNEKEKEDAVKAVVARGSNKYLQTSFDFKVSDGQDKGITAHSTFTMDDYAKQAGKEWYINMNLLRSFEDLWVDIKKRDVALENNYKSQIRQVVELEIPKGFHVQYLPETAETKSDKMLSYKISYEQKGNKVKLIKEYEVNTLYVAPEDFNAHNKIIEDLKKQYKESIVLVADQ